MRFLTWCFLIIGMAAFSWQLLAQMKPGPPKNPSKSNITRRVSPRAVDNTPSAIAGVNFKEFKPKGGDALVGRLEDTKNGVVCYTMRIRSMHGGTAMNCVQKNK